MNRPLNVHGTGLVLGDVGVLLRGPSGAGKSVLSMALLDRWETRGKPAFLVGDDRIDLVEEDGRLVMLAPPQLAGMIELRGRGIVTRPHRDRAPLDLVIDLVPEMVRMVEEEDLVTTLMGHQLPRAPVPQAGIVGLGHQELLVSEAVRATLEQTKS
jgi:serine kinase of HPr protein (carbohydrate metabolism regulator)